MKTGKHGYLLGTVAICTGILMGGIAAPAYAANEPSPSASAVVITSESPSPSPTPSPSSTTNAPNSPTGLKWTKTATTSVKLSWSEAAVDDTHAAADYYLVTTTVDGKTRDQNKRVTGTSVSYTGIDPNSVMTATVAAVNASGTSDTASAPRWTQPAVAPSAPDSVTITSATSTNIKVSWSAPDNDGGSPITAYRVRLYQEDAIYYEQTLDVVSTTDSFTSLQPGQTYHVTVAAVNKAGTSKEASSRDVDLPRASAVPTPTRTVVITPNTPTSTVPTPSASDTQLQTELGKVQQRQAQLEAQQRAAQTWAIIGLLGLLLAAAVVALIFVLRYNKRVDEYNRQHNLGTGPNPSNPRK